jgi:hypothetical protein
MSPQLSLAALASALALVALCFQAPTIGASSGATFGTPAAAMADLGAPGLRLPSLLPH